jgi:succinylarginine dihydrolase
VSVREYNFDGLVGITHNYGGLSPGNVASTIHEGQVSNPRQAALQGLTKMKFVCDLGVGQGVLPPQPRPNVSTLRMLGFYGSDEEVLAEASGDDALMLRLCSSAAAMWTANAATVAPSADTADGKLHITPANLQCMFHRAIEASTTHAVLRAIFANEKRFTVHAPLPGGGQFSDEGAANHTRLFTSGHDAVHLLAWGRTAYGEKLGPSRFPARQTREASSSLARLHRIRSDRAILWQQHPDGIDAGAFHTDVLAVGNGSFFMTHELAFVEIDALLATLRARLGDELTIEIARERDLPARDAVVAYPFNSQVVTLDDGSMAIIAPIDSRENDAARAFLERVIAADNPVREVHYLDLRQSMHNGGGPACLRQRIVLTNDERAAIDANVFFNDALHATLRAWVERHYPERLHPSDLRDPKLWRACMESLDELTRILALGSVYDFQRTKNS